MSKIQLHACLVIGLLLLVAAGVRSAKPFKMEGRPNTEFEGVPLVIGDWQGRNTKIDPQTLESLSSCSLLSRLYQRELDPVPVGLTVVYGTDLKDFHQPEVCLEGQGLSPVSKGDVTIHDKDGDFPAVGLVTERDYRRQVFVYWFVTRGMSSTSLGRYKLNMLRDRLFVRKVQPSAMIRLSTIVYDMETEQDAMERVLTFADTVFPYLKSELDADARRSRE